MEVLRERFPSSDKVPQKKPGFADAPECVVIARKILLDFK